MLAARLHGPSDLRVERLPHPGNPGAGEALLRVRVTGVCGSDLHTYQDARIGDTPVTSPLVLGHEFAAVVEAVGPGAQDGCHRPLLPGTRVAVDPAQPCGQCELCARGHPNLCPSVAFCGCHPYGGSLCEWIRMPAHCCFPVPDSIDDETVALLEPLGVALHAVDLGRLRLGDHVAVLGAGPIGLLILQLALCAGAGRVLVSDPLDWRRKLAKRLGAVPLDARAAEVPDAVGRLTGGRGVDVVFEAAWGDGSVETAAEVARFGGRVVLVGIPSEDRLMLKHSTARRKGLTLVLSRRMKHVVPRCIRLAAEAKVMLRGLVTHRFALAQAAEALALNSQYRDRVVKVMVTS
jgi:L-iditol 2-dehydrogenase